MIDRKIEVEPEPRFHWDPPDIVLPPREALTQEQLSEFCREVFKPTDKPRRVLCMRCGVEIRECECGYKDLLKHEYGIDFDKHPL